MPYFITTIHVAVDADNVNQARRKVDAFTEEAANDCDCLTDCAYLLGYGRANLVEVPHFDPESDDLHQANERARGGSHG